MSEKIVVAGALGLVGAAVVDHFVAAGHEVIGVSRRKGTDRPGATFLSVDLSNTAQCRDVFEGMRDVSRIVYASVSEKPALVEGWFDQEHRAVNLSMLRNVIDNLVPNNPGLRHVALLQGGKAYGVHLGQISVPAKESSPRHLAPNFYWDQEDLIKERQRGHGWSWTIFRPQAIIGRALGSPMNIVAALGAYAAVSRELGHPLVFPGVGRAVVAATDVGLLARAIDWGAGADKAANQILNVTNGDFFTFRDIWPVFARRFGMEMGVARPAPLSILMAEKEDLWRAMVQKYQLQAQSLHTLIGGSWEFTDWAMGERNGATALVMSTIKIRQAGFAECLDTEECFDGWLRRLQDERLLPC